MSENERLCRTCLRADNLAPIFAREEHHERYTAALFLTTGLQIELDDGMPQTICKECIHRVNTAIDFRNQSQKSERTLLQQGCRRNSSTSSRDSNLKAYNAFEHIGAKLTLSDDICKVKSENYYLDDGEFDAPMSDVDLKSSGEYDKTKFWNGSHVGNDEKVPTSTRRTKVDRKKRYESLVDGPMGGPGPYECKVCKKILKSWSSFRTHAKIHLGFDFMCEYCGKTFIAVTMLQRHCMSQHGLERTYRCNFCEHRALDSERLKIHERREHTGDRPYVCDACGASFLTRRNLVHHLAVHVTQRTVQCAKCPAKFKSAQHLACHTSKVHRHRDWRMECYLCDNTYTKYENVRKHLAKIHGVPRQHQATIRRVRVAVEA